jgi:hypothetical protein
MRLRRQVDAPARQSQEESITSAAGIANALSQQAGDLSEALE